MILTQLYITNKELENKLINQIRGTIRDFDKLYAFLSPILSKNPDSFLFLDEQEIKRELPAPMMHDLMHLRLVNAAINYIRKNRGKKQVPKADAATHHALHLSKELFSFSKIQLDDAVSKRGSNFVKNQFNISFFQDPNLTATIENVNERELNRVNYIIITPRMQRGSNNILWDLRGLVLQNSSDYMIEHVVIKQK
jgi:hypothetical protein